MALESLHGLAVLYGEEWLWRAYGRTSDSVKTGRPAFDLVHGQALFEYLRTRPEAAATFNGAMTAYTEQECAAILAAYDFSTAANIVDVGGGEGALLAALLKAYPQANGVLFEQASVIDRARTAMTSAGVADRCATLSGSFFETIPERGDAYVLKSVLHDWDDERGIAILENCRDAMHGRSRLLIIERVVPEGKLPSEASLFDINMLVIAGGLERTAREYRKLLDEAGFELTRIVPTEAYLSIVEAVPRAQCTRAGPYRPKHFHREHQM